MTRKAPQSDYDLIRRICEKNSRISKRVVDDFLIGFAARHHSLGKRMNQYFSKYRHVLSLIGRSGTEMFQAQYIAHRIFRESGLIDKFLRNPALNHISGEERKYLEEQASVPWRFSFSEITEEPAKDFFIMRDAFTEEEYLLFSPSIGSLKTRGNILLWLNLIGFNGYCWQSYGPIAEFQSFGPDDIFFFATEKNPAIENETEVLKDIEDDPLPYMLLLSGSAYPRTFHKDDELIVVMSEYELQNPDTVKLKKKFISEYNEGVYRFTHRELGKHPHFAQIYFNETDKSLLFHTMTLSGFYRLVEEYNSLGYNVPAVPYLMVHLQMVATAESILKTKIVLNEYEHLFLKDKDPVGDEYGKKVNKFLEQVIPQINKEQEPDIAEAARISGLDPLTATEILNTIMKQVRMPKTPGSGGPKKSMSKKEKGGAESGINVVTGRKEKSGAVNEGNAGTVKKVAESPLLNKIFLAANVICNMEPWEGLYETDIFGIRMPVSGQTWYISVMGRNGEFMAIAAYKGIEGLAGFYSIQENADTVAETSILTVPHLLLSFNDRELLDKDDREVLRKSGVTVRGKGRWPRLEEIIPGFVPAFPGEDTLAELPGMLEQVIWVIFETVSKPGILRKKGRDGEKMLIRISSGDPAKPAWKSQYEAPDIENFSKKYTPKCNPGIIEAVAKLKPVLVTIQTDLVLIPAPVKEKGKKGYFPFMLLLMDKTNGMIAGTDLLHPDPDLQSVYESFPEKLLGEILKLGYRPNSIEFRSELLLGLSKVFLRQSGCTPVLVELMPEMENAIASLMEHLSGK